MTRDELPALIQALLDPTAYPAPRPATIELRQTHISYILLAGERVYKINKPVNLRFVDYSTPPRRVYYRRQKVRPTRRLSPSVYLDVVPMGARREGMQMGGGGRALERAVVMRRLREAAM